MSKSSYNNSYFRQHTGYYLGRNLVKIPSFAWVKKEIEAKPRERILDAGCGMGYLLNFVCGRKARGVGVDVSEEAIKTAKKLFPHHQFIRGDLTQLPFKDKQFDKVVCFNVIEHLKEQDRALRELKRVLREGGIFVAGTNIKDSLSWCLFKIFLGGDPTHVKEFTAGEFVNFLSQYFKVEKTVRSSCIGRFSEPINRLLSLYLKGDILIKAIKV